MIASRLNHSPDHATIEWRSDLDHIAVFHPTAVDKETVGRDWGDRHFRHGWPPDPDERFLIIGHRWGLPPKRQSGKEGGR
jgi:hypothetical protein